MTFKESGSIVFASSGSCRISGARSPSLEGSWCWFHCCWGSTPPFCEEGATLAHPGFWNHRRDSLGRMDAGPLMVLPPWFSNSCLARLFLKDHCCKASCCCGLPWHSPAMLYWIYFQKYTLPSSASHKKVVANGLRRGPQSSPLPGLMMTYQILPKLSMSRYGWRCPCKRHQLEGLEEEHPGDGGQRLPLEAGGQHAQGDV